MSNHGTLSNESPGWYVQFQADVLLQLPRPEEIGQDVASGWHNNRGAMKQALRSAFCPPEVTTGAFTTGLLIPVGSAIVAPTMNPFVARDRFVVNNPKKVVTKISFLGDNFKAWFLDKKEGPFAGSTLKYGRLSRYSVDGPIITELGGEEQAETTLTEVSALMEKQKNGEAAGPLLTNGYANIFYVRDVNNVLRTVGVHWGDDGWDVHARGVAFPLEWDDGDQVFFRNSRLLSPV